jgi:uncharacterized protein (DUF305 family)
VLAVTVVQTCSLPIPAAGGGTARAATSGTGLSGGAPATTASTQPPATFNDADVMFAQMMIPHHQQAVEMAELAGTRAADKEVKTLAAKIKAAQDPEIRTMRGWLAQWGKPLPPEGVNPAMGHEMPGMMSQEDMKKLADAKGTAFDRRFAELMIEHHDGAIEMARTEQAQGANPAAKKLAENIETAQQAEVAQLRQILERS